MISIAYANVCGWRNKNEEWRYELSGVSGARHDVLGVCETMMSAGAQQQQMSGWQWDAVNSAAMPGERAHGGVGVWHRSSLGADVEASRSSSDALVGRVQWLHLPGSGGYRATSVAMLYAPVASGAAGAVRAAERFWQQLGAEVAMRSADSDVLLLGDMNGRVGMLGDSKENANGRLLLAMCEAQDLVVLNAEHAFGVRTYSRGDRVSSTIDYVRARRCSASCACA